MGAIGGVVVASGGSTPVAKSTPAVTGSASVAVELPDPTPKPTKQAAPVTRTASPARKIVQTVSRAPAPAPRRSSGGPQKRTALLVGINNAVGSSLLAGSTTDMQNIRSALIKYGFPSGNIKMLLNGAATRGAVINELDALSRRTSSDGIAVFAVAAHSSNKNGASFKTVEGQRVSAGEVGSRLGRVAGKVWSIFATCYAGAYAVPGTVGRDRIANFSSSPDERSWQLGAAGSYLVRGIARFAILDGNAPKSVESAFAYAHKRLLRDDPGYEGKMSDGVSGELILGHSSWAKTFVKATPPPVNVPNATPNLSGSSPPSEEFCSGLLGFLC